MDVTDKIVGAIIAFAVIAIGLPLGLGFLENGDFNVTIGGTNMDLSPVLILLAVIVVLGVVVLVYKNTKGHK
jgi:DNA-binding transcriptional regulator of glucitol operon